jgi:hypothetical protein
VAHVVLLLDAVRQVGVLRITGASNLMRLARRGDAVPAPPALGRPA